MTFTRPTARAGEEEEEEHEDGGHGSSDQPSKPPVRAGGEGGAAAGLSASTAAQLTPRIRGLVRLCRLSKVLEKYRTRLTDTLKVHSTHHHTHRAGTSVRPGSQPTTR